MTTLTTLAPYFMAAGIPLAVLTIYAFGWMVAPDADDPITQDRFKADPGCE